MRKHNKLCINDYVMCILGLSDEDNPYRLLILDIYKAFDGICRKNERFRKQTGLYFSVRGNNVYSKEIEVALFSAGTAGLMEIIGPGFDECIIHKKETKDYFRKVLSPEDFSWLCELANEFKETIEAFAREREAALSK